MSAESSFSAYVDRDSSDRAAPASPGSTPASPLATIVAFLRRLFDPGRV
jgi:hypothetical protein